MSDPIEITHESGRRPLSAKYRIYWRGFDGTENAEIRTVLYVDNGWDSELDHCIKRELQHDWNVYPKPYRVEVLRDGEPPYDLVLPSCLRDSR